MENRLRTLFDYQHFENNDKLQILIHDTHRRIRSNALSDDQMSTVSAAGSWSANYEEVKDKP